jgi:hypothetical protein
MMVCTCAEIPGATAKAIASVNSHNNRIVLIGILSDALNSGTLDETD